MSILGWICLSIVALNGLRHLVEAINLMRSMPARDEAWLKIKNGMVSNELWHAAADLALVTFFLLTQLEVIR